MSENPLAKVAKTASVAVESKDGKKAPKAMETQVLEQSIHKICSLLSVSEQGALGKFLSGGVAWQACQCACRGKHASVAGPGAPQMPLPLLASCCAPRQRAASAGAETSAARSEPHLSGD